MTTINLDDLKVALKDAMKESRPMSFPIPTYDGRARWDEYIIKFQRAAKANKMNDNRAYEVLPACLAGPAADIFEQIPTTKYNNLQELIDEMAKAMADSSRTNIMRMDLHAKPQRTDEAVATYAKRKKAEVALGYPSARFNDATTKLLLKDAFIKGLRPEYRKQLMRQNYATVEDAIQAAQVEERLQNEYLEESQMEKTVSAVINEVNNIQSRTRQPWQGQFRNFRPRWQQPMSDQQPQRVRFQDQSQ